MTLVIERLQRGSQHSAVSTAAVTVLSDPAAVSTRAAAQIAAALKRAIATSGTASIALSGGSSPAETYAKLAATQGIDWSRVHVFWVDERAVGPQSDRSNFKLVQQTLLEVARIPPGNVHRMPGEAADLGAAAIAYEAELVAVLGKPPRLDVAVLGVGDDGHTASIFPGSRLVGEQQQLVAAVEAQGGREARLTLTPAALFAARERVVIAFGEGKAKALSAALAPGASVLQTPAALFASVPGTRWLIDAAAVKRKAQSPTSAFVPSTGSAPVELGADGVREASLAADTDSTSLAQQLASGLEKLEADPFAADQLLRAVTAQARAGGAAFAEAVSRLTAEQRGALMRFIAAQPELVELSGLEPRQ